MGELGGLAPSCTSCCRKSDQSSANDSFLVPPSGEKSVDKTGVEGVRCHGEIGTLKFGFDAPGRTRPACSRCSTVIRMLMKACTSGQILPSVQSSKAAII